MSSRQIHNDLHIFAPQAHVTALHQKVSLRRNQVVSKVCKLKTKTNCLYFYVEASYHIRCTGSRNLPEQYLAWLGHESMTLSTVYISALKQKTG